MAARTFGELIRQLAEKHHKGHYYPMARRLGISIALIYFWRDDVVKNPNPDTIARLCEVYDLEFWDVMALIMKRPAPRPRTGLKKAVIRLLVLATLGGLLPHLEPQQMYGNHLTSLLLIGAWLARFWPRLTGPGPTLSPATV